jgi:hypothetical protein
MITELRIFLLASAVSLITVAPPAVAQAATATAANTPSLKGKVQKQDAPMRIRRPELPPMGVAESGEPSGAAVTTRSGPSLHGVASENDFMLNFKKQSPVFAPTSLSGQAAKHDNNSLASEAEDKELVIEWEEWHHRVSEAIFQRWRNLGVFPGIAHTTLTFTRAGRVFVTVHAVDLPDNLFQVIMPQYRGYSMEEIRRQFARAVEDSVLPLNGSSTVRFPERSHRDMVTLTPNFAGDVDEGYNWKHGDTERVQLP